MLRELFFILVTSEIVNHHHNILFNESKFLCSRPDIPHPPETVHMDVILLNILMVFLIPTSVRIFIMVRDAFKLSGCWT